MEVYREMFLDLRILKNKMLDSKRIKQLFNELFPLNRSIVGPAIQQSHRIIEKYIGSDANFIKIPSGTKINGWAVPKEWSITRSWGRCKETNQIIFDTDISGLHVWSHSVNFSGELTRTELELGHIRVHPVVRNAIPYITAYYSNTWGISITKEKLEVKFLKLRIQQ